MIKNLLKEYSSLIENRINELFPEVESGYSAVSDAARYSLLLGGKRIRPAITLLFCELCGGKTEDALDFAVALEMIHTYSLIHDDLPCMDDDDMRRGNPSCHKKFGEDIALLAGDTLLTQAFYVASVASVSPEIKVKAAKVLSESAGLHGMIGGQVLDLSFEKIRPDAEKLTDMYMRKTAALLICAAKLGIIAAGKDTEQNLKSAEIFGFNLGLAFQVIDDILDCTADEKLLGKPVGSDEKNQKTTCVTLYGIEKSREIAADMTDKAISALKNFGGDTEKLENLTEFLLSRNY
ncbi:MAG: polyprenyl synthetase family protein [Clostridia bacterium]|nr:polyprenyl synthetase family protein [Clostridia bacterium]